LHKDDLYRSWLSSALMPIRTTRKMVDPYASRSRPELQRLKIEMELLLRRSKNAVQLWSGAAFLAGGLDLAEAGVTGKPATAPRADLAGAGVS